MPYAIARATHTHTRARYFRFNSAFNSDGIYYATPKQFCIIILQMILVARFDAMHTANWHCHFNAESNENNNKNNNNNHIFFYIFPSRFFPRQYIIYCTAIF